MAKSPIVMASDHRGARLKDELRCRLERAGYEVLDIGTHGDESVDYPEFAGPAARAVSEGKNERAILICGSGLGVMYTANRFPRVRAAWVQDAEAAQMSRRHNDANVLALPGDRLDGDAAWPIVQTWLETAFEGGRHERRVRQIDELTRVEGAAGVRGGVLLTEADPEIAGVLRREARRQALNLELIASENFVSEPVLEAVGSVLTNKYAEGYPGRRYYGGCEVVDEAEELARQRAETLFGADHANVQPHSGSQANQAVYTAVCDIGDTVLAMNLDHGGHLTHGSPVNFSGKLYRIVPYGVRREDERIDYDQVRSLALEHRPRMIQCGTTAYSRTLDFEAFRSIADEVEAVLFADIAHIAGFVATGLHPTPVGHAQIVTTTTHKTLRGPRGGLILCDQEWAKKIDNAIFPGGQGGPLMHVIAAKAVALREAAAPEFRQYCGRVLENARGLAAALSERDFCIVSGGTDTHLFLLSLVDRDTTGKAAQLALERAGITVNKNMVPFDPRKPMVTSGVRIGTPAVTTRGMGESEMEEIAGFIARVLEHPGDVEALDEVRADVETLCRRFPLYPDRWDDRA
ncbi:MAG: ribose 5-phosphate isomerase B [Myxococcota bacterium]|nr:ribose 5-phosphate isomerase B [Deltaproteobacteria bacterium]MDP6076220.1 ribose 5-phosphate isomerase B [Myxococcota bacterium]MDP6242214.1 ribose 5-phosphate isomerase B [Myxococcota bacterium]MDP7074926.1 ribose 5-phosphate isomerase B [Myxococcota bacterium]MDP7298970.1 ribose 5-phosphate isomerase B [Myxococcota bacterium]